MSNNTRWSSHDTCVNCGPGMQSPTAEPPEDLTQLARDVARPEDEQARRQRAQVERAAAVEVVDLRQSPHRGHGRPGTDVDHHLVRPVALAVHLDGVRTDEAPVSAHE